MGKSISNGGWPEITKTPSTASSWMCGNFTRASAMPSSKPCSGGRSRISRHWPCWTPSSTATLRGCPSGTTPLSGWPTFTWRDWTTTSKSSLASSMPCAMWTIWCCSARQNANCIRPGSGSPLTSSPWAWNSRGIGRCSGWISARWICWATAFTGTMSPSAAGTP